MEQSVTGKSCGIAVTAFQDKIQILIQERTPRGIVCRDVFSVKAVKRFIKYLEAAIAEVEEEEENG